MSQECVIGECNVTNKAKKHRIALCKFPQNPELLRYWLHNLNRAYWRPTSESVLCASHFQPDDFAITGPVYRKQKPGVNILKDYAVPTIFHNTPTGYKLYSTSEVQTKLQEEERRAALLKSQIAAMKQESYDFVMDWANFKAHVKTKVNLEVNGKVNYNIFENDEKVVFYQVTDSLDSECMISLRICVSSALIVRVLIGESEDSRHFERLRINGRKLIRFSQLANLLDAYRNGETTAETENISCECLMKRALQWLIKAKTVSSNFSKADKLDIIINQLECSLRARSVKYNSETMKMSFLLFSNYHSTYELLRQFLHLPGKATLNRMTSKMLISTNFEITTRKDRNLSDPENYVALVIDEFYIIHRGIQYNNEKFVGTAILNPTQDPKTLLLDTKTVLTFTIKSIFGNLQELVRMSPGIYPFGDIIYKHTKSALDHVQQLGFNVKLILADTTINSRRIFQRFSQHNHPFTNPEFPADKIYLQYDVMHILKDIRNDWYDLTNVDRTFIYPDMETFEIKEAAFGDLESLVKMDKLNTIKKVPKLTEDTLNPNVKDRHNVAFICNIFDESTIVALNGNDGMSETADFLTTIKKWFDILVSNEPIVLASDPRLKYLETFVEWMDTWRKSRGNQGRLKPATYHAIETTTKTLIDLIKFSFSNCQAEFLQLAKLQKDNTENRFKFYESKMKANATESTDEFDDFTEDIFKDNLDDPLDWESEYLENDEANESYKFSVTMDYVDQQ